jgi:hypothetical protein
MAEQRDKIAREAIIGAAYVSNLPPIDQSDSRPGSIDKRYEFHDARFATRLVDPAIRRLTVK